MLSIYYKNISFQKKTLFYQTNNIMSSKANYKVYMDVQIGASGAGRIVF